MHQSVYMNERIYDPPHTYLLKKLLLWWLEEKSPQYIVDDMQYLSIPQVCNGVVAHAIALLDLASRVI